MPGDLVLSKPEQDPEGKCEWKAVEEVFTNFLPIWELHVGDQIIRTSAEHPFYVVGLGWLAAAMLQSGHLLLTHDGRTLPVKTIINTGEEKPVYNIRVADFHTYFVGCDEWGFSVWAHNACATVYQWDNGENFSHWSVSISDNGVTLHTHQVITSADHSTTRIVDVAQFPQTINMPLTAQGTVEITNPAAGIALEQAMTLIPDTGPYNQVTNSCISYVCQVLSAAGAQGVPAPSGSQQYRFLRRIVKGP